ncbi:DUF4878 domain-containing protein [Pseudomonas sp. LRF_L74]|uniref:DUF4878 domain-containing protein n=1 Tax=Pseudomonas sp. LRF_L74 TaxID=3369422 RepID=UPI003F62EE30
MAQLKHWLFIFTAALLLCACSSSDKPEAVAKDFLKAAYSNDLDTVLKLINMPDKDKPGVEDVVRGKLKAALTKSAEQVKALDGIDKIEVADATYNDDKSIASVQATITFNKDGAPPKQERVRLIKVDDAWKVGL